MATEIISKRCSQCKQNKPLSEFSKDRRNKDGIRGCCKSCQKAYEQSEKGKAVNRKKTAKYQQTPGGKAVNRKTTAEFYARNPNYAKAKNAVNSAIRAGKLPRPDSFQCPYCPGPAQEYHHHKGYEPEHWLDVVPVCKKCHSKCNRKIA